MKTTVQTANDNFRNDSVQLSTNTSHLNKAFRHLFMWEVLVSY